MHNPAMYVPELGEVIWGCGSFWSRIESEADFQDITDEEQNNVFYMRWLRGLSKRKKPDVAGDEYHAVPVCSIPCIRRYGLRHRPRGAKLIA